MVEGGHAFDDVTPFSHDKIPQILSKVNKVLSKIGVKTYPIGSGATPTSGKMSGDLDLIVDQDELAKKFNLDNLSKVRKALRSLFEKAGYEVKQSGISVHVRVPVGDKFHQVDIMTVPDVPNISKIHTHNIPPGSKWKGVHKQIALSNLAKDKNMLWSGFQGLFARDENGKKADLITRNPDQIAKLLIGDHASGKDIASVEAILSALGPKAKGFLEKLRSDPSWKE